MRKIKILFILCLSFFMFGCMERLEVVSIEQKASITENWIVDEIESSKELAMKNINYLTEKKESDNSKIRAQAQQELEEWYSAIHNAQEKKKRLEKERIELEKERIDNFFNEFCYLLIKNDLREPESYQLDYVYYRKNGNKYSISHSFRAKNGFGGYSKEFKTYEFKFTDEELKSDVRIVVIQKKLELLKQLIQESEELIKTEELIKRHNQRRFYF